MKPGEGVGGQVLKTGRSVITNAYQEDVRLPAHPALREPADRRRRADALGRRAARRAVDRLQPHAPRHAGRPAAARGLRRPRLRRLPQRRGVQLRRPASTPSPACSSTARSRRRWPSASRGPTRLACLLVDLDGFDAVNERDGPPPRRRRAAPRRGADRAASAARTPRSGASAATSSPPRVRSDPAAIAERIVAELHAELDLAASVGVAHAEPGVERRRRCSTRALRAARAAKQAGGGRVSG